MAIVGWEQPSYTVHENVSFSQVCVRLTYPNETQTLLFDVRLNFETRAKTAGERLSVRRCSVKQQKVIVVLYGVRVGLCMLQDRPIYIIILDPDERRRTTTVHSNDTLVDTPFQLISGFFHVNKVLCVVSMLSKLPPGVC